jgi:hypothetical protein
MKEAQMSEISISTEPVKLSQPWLLEDIEVEFFGKGNEVRDILKKTFDLRIGDRPFSRSVRKLYRAGNRQLPPDIAALKGETYLITHAIGMAAQSKAGNVDILGYKAWFEDPGSTVELFPNTRFKEYISADLKFKAGVAADGYAKTPEILTNLAKEIINLGAGAELQLGTQASVVGNLSLSLKTPVIQAVGHASSTVTWQFDKDNQPLVGDQVMVQTIVVPKGQGKITYKIQGYAVIDPGIFRRAIRVETEVLTAEVELE